MPFFSKVFRAKDGAGAGAAASSSPSASALEQGAGYAPPKPRWEDAWLRTEVDPDEVQQLLHGCTVEVKSRGMNLLPCPERSTGGMSRLTVLVQASPCHSCCSHSVPTQMPAPPSCLCATISTRSVGVEARTWRLSCSMNYD